MEEPKSLEKEPKGTVKYRVYCRVILIFATLIKKCTYCHNIKTIWWQTLFYYTEITVLFYPVYKSWHSKSFIPIV